MNRSDHWAVSAKRRALSIVHVMACGSGSWKINLAAQGNVSGGGECVQNTPLTWGKVWPKHTHHEGRSVPKTQPSHVQEVWPKQPLLNRGKCGQNTPLSCRSVAKINLSHVGKCGQNTSLSNTGSVAKTPLKHREVCPKHTCHVREVWPRHTRHVGEVWPKHTPCHVGKCDQNTPTSRTGCVS